MQTPASPRPLYAAPRPAGPVVWNGIVAIERPDVSRLSADADPKVWVKSARTQVMGLRAICVQLPYSLLAHKFRDSDRDCCYCYAELIGEHLHVLERASVREYFNHPEQLTAFA